MKKFIFLILLGFLLTTAYAENNLEKQVDDVAYQAMYKYQVPAISLAIIDNGKIIYTRAYSTDPNLIVTPQSLFQSASIGKSVTAYGALLLVAKGKIPLDANINDYLRSWKIPENPYTRAQPVTLRNILSMTSGLSVPGFAGYFINQPLPALKQILNGQAPANNSAVKVLFAPGSQYFYSGGSYVVIQQLIEDITHVTFSSYMSKNVLKPLDMQQSQFIAILPKPLWPQAVPGFLKQGEMIPGKWKIIAALGAGGLWTTPTDLAKFAVNVMQSYHGETQGLLPQNIAQEMLTRQKNTDFGLGFVIDGCNKNLNFRKEGHNIGFYNWLIAFPNTKQGVVVMTNSENGVPAIKAVITKIGQLYHWPHYYPIVDESQQIPASSCEN